MEYNCKIGWCLGSRRVPKSSPDMRKNINKVKSSGVDEKWSLHRLNRRENTWYNTFTLSSEHSFMLLDVKNDSEFL